MNAPLRIVAAGLLAAPGLAQQPVFQTPGMPNWSASGQQDRFTNDGNPSMGVMLDGFGDYVRFQDDGEADGFDLFLRSLEFTANGRVDPNWWGYAVVVYADEEVELEEGAVTYAGFEGNTTIRFGRFFVDFGKQMQAHIHDLPYPERPGVLAEYLGEELPGVGAQVDHWWTTGDASALRASVGVFGELESHGHGEEEGGDEVAAELPERTDVDEFGFTARVTQFMDVGERGVLQWGGSARHQSGFEFHDEANDLSTDRLSNTVYGVDLTYGIDSDDGISGWTFGGEALLATGDLSAEADAGLTALDVFDDDVYGFYAWAERRIDRVNTVGALYSQFQHLEDGKDVQSEVTAYWSRYFSEFARLRFAVSHAEVDGPGGGSTRALVQLTTFFGPHAHGVNW